MVTRRKYDAVVIGAGAGGMAAACSVCRAGLKTAVIEREDNPGGILLQCIHNGFGLHHFGRELTGPEYAEEYIDAMAALPVDLFTGATAVSIQTGKKTRSVVAYSAAHGVCELTARAVVLAMGCRERNRGNIGIPGTRPSGIFTAGLAQRLLNIEGYLPGKNIVIVGSGDIGLIMARRLTWVGCKVHCVVELLPHPSGLTRNIVQCLQDFGIPLHISHTVTNISGHDRVQSVDISPVENGVPVESKTFTVACDTVLLSVGLVPENELSRAAGVEINHDTGGPVVDHTLQTSVPGVFACGNVLHVHDLVDFVSDEGRRCGEHVVRYVRGVKPAAGPGNTPVRAGANLKYVVPNSFARDSDGRFFMRPLVVRDTADLAVRQGDTLVRRKKLRHLRPAEMISLELTDAEKEKIRPDAALEFSIT